LRAKRADKRRKKRLILFTNLQVIYRLLGAEGIHGICLSRPVCRDVAGDERDTDDNEAHHRVGRRVGRTYIEDQSLQDACKRQRCGNAQSGTHQCELDRLHQNKPQYLALLRTQGHA